MKVDYYNQSNNEIVRTDYECVLLTESQIIDCPEEINISRLFFNGQYIELNISSTEKNRDINIDTIIFRQSGSICNDSKRILHVDTIIIDYGNGFYKSFNIAEGYNITGVCYDYSSFKEDLFITGEYIDN